MKIRLFIFCLIIIGLTGCSKPSNKNGDLVKAKVIKNTIANSKKKKKEEQNLLKESVKWAESAEAKSEAQKFLSSEFKKYDVDMVVDSIIPIYGENYLGYRIEYIDARVNFKGVRGWVNLKTQTEKKPFTFQALDQKIPYDVFCEWMFYDVLFEYYQKRVNDKYHKIIPRHYISNAISKLDPQIKCSDSYIVFSPLEVSSEISIYHNFKIEDLNNLNKICSSSAENEEDFLRFMDKFMKRCGPVVFKYSLFRGKQGERYLNNERVMKIEQKIINKIMTDKRFPSGIYEFKIHNEVDPMDDYSDKKITFRK